MLWFPLLPVHLLRLRRLWRKWDRRNLEAEEQDTQAARLSDD
jgi:hypothetical protein